MYDIDIKSSIQKSKIVEKTSFWNKLSDVFFYALVFGGLPFVAIINLKEKLDQQAPLQTAVIILIVIMLLVFYLLYALVNIDKLYRIPGVSKNMNRKIVLEVAEELDWINLKHTQHISVFSKKWTWTSWHWGRRLIVIYDRNDVLINCISYGHYELKSPFHHWIDRRTINKWKKKILQKN